MSLDILLNMLSPGHAPPDYRLITFWPYSVSTLMKAAPTTLLHSSLYHDPLSSGMISHHCVVHGFEPVIFVRTMYKIMMVAALLDVFGSIARSVSFYLR